MEYLSLIVAAGVCLMVGVIGGLSVFVLTVAASNKSRRREREEIIKECEVDE